VAVGGIGVAVGGIGVAVGGIGVAVGNFSALLTEIEVKLITRAVPILGVSDNTARVTVESGLRISLAVGMGSGVAVTIWTTTGATVGKTLADEERLMAGIATTTSRISMIRATGMAINPICERSPTRNRLPGNGALYACGRVDGGSVPPPEEIPAGAPFTKASDGFRTGVAEANSLLCPRIEKRKILVGSPF